MTNVEKYIRAPSAELGFTYCNRPARQWTNMEIAIFRRMCEFPMLFGWFGWVYDVESDEAFPV